MIQPLRRRHAWLAPSAFGLAAFGLVLAVAARPGEFVSERRALDGPPAAPENVAQHAWRALDEPAVRVAYHADLEPALWIVVDERIDAPDVLAYHTSRTSWEGALPGDARLVGEVAPEGATALESPTRLEGRLVLFSLGHQAVLGTIDLAAPGSGRD